MKVGGGDAFLQYMSIFMFVMFETASWFLLESIIPAGKNLNSVELSLESSYEYCVYMKLLAVVSYLLYEVAYLWGLKKFWFALFLAHSLVFSILHGFKVINDFMNYKMFFREKRYDCWMLVFVYLLQVFNIVAVVQLLQNFIY